jgi:hypothetical protein
MSSSDRTILESSCRPIVEKDVGGNEDVTKTLKSLQICGSLIRVSGAFGCQVRL